MSNPISVEARFSEDGSILPLKFNWQGQAYTITSHGRQWEENGVLHFLVMAAGDNAFELTYHTDERSWRLQRSPTEFGRRDLT
ncbi:MAG: hypothetical protein GTO18_07075 [Anaerolineales bacterium]|nr:hypothetical protein [Anaerolineales bacterium]